jgi:hypothetical protein
MGRDDDHHDDQPSEPAENPDKAEKIARQRARLLEDVAANATQDLKGKVGYTLSHYPDARDSDRVLVERLLTTFYPEHVHHGAVAFDDLRHLPSVTSMVRWRQKIQNEYEIFTPSEEVAEFRRTLRRGTKDEMIAAKPGPPVIQRVCGREWQEPAVSCRGCRLGHRHCPNLAH